MKMKKKAIITLVIALALGMLAACGNSSSTSAASAADQDSSLQDLQDAGVMKVGMCPEYPPFESLNDDGDYEGFDVDLANAIGEKLGVDVEFVNTPYEGLIAGLQNGDYDIIMSGMSPEEADQADKDLNVTENYYAVNEVILTKDANIKSGDDLNGKTVGCHAGSTSEYAVQDLISDGIDITEAPYNRHSEAFADLQNGNIDAQIVEDTWAKAKVEDGSDIIIVEEPVSTINMAGVIGKGKTSFTDAFNSALDELKEDGTYDELVDKWFS